jgi:hypothetical protein
VISEISALGTNGVKTEDQHETATALATVPRAAGEKATQQCQGSPSSSLPLTGGDLFDPQSLLPTAFGLASCQVIQPIADVATYLEKRTPQPHYLGEEALLITLPNKRPARLQDETRALVRAVHFVAKLVKDKFSVQAACREAIRVYKDWHWKLETFRQKYDEWAKAKDWTVLVNCSKAPVAWRKGNAGLPDEFLTLCEIRFGQFARADGKRQALLSLKRQWKTGRNEAGVEEPIAGYDGGPGGTPWKKRNPEIIPDGWHYSNITRQIIKRARFTQGVRALLHDSESAARQFLPQHLGTRKNLRFLEKVTFDDVRMDWLVFNAETGEAEELWLLIARDEATAMVLGFVMHPATVDENGKASHLGAQQMKELVAYVLETYPLPPYLVHWVVERGTATLAEAVKLALGELFDNRIKVHYTSMIGDGLRNGWRNSKRPRGYAEKAKGNSRGKASHEAHNRLFHTQGSYLPGQTGAHYGIRPADLESRIAECREIWQLRQCLPESKRGDEKYPLTVLQTQARAVIRQFCLEQNFRTEHNLEGFDQVLEWFDGQKWQPGETAPPGAEFRRRMEMPVERAMRLIRSVDKWTRCSPDIIRTFLEHTERVEYVSVKGEIQLKVDGKPLTFCNGGVPLAPGTKVLVYHHPDDPQFIHLTSGDGRILGTWAQRGRTAYLDQEALAKAMRYTHAAREAAKAVANELAAPQRAALDDMRQHNASLAQFVVTADVPPALDDQRGNAVAAGISNAGTERASFETNPPKVEPVPDSTEQLLKRAAANPALADEGFE